MEQMDVIDCSFNSPLVISTRDSPIDSKFKFTYLLLYVMDVPCCSSSVIGLDAYLEGESLDDLVDDADESYLDKLMDDLDRFAYVTDNDQFKESRIPETTLKK